MSREQKLALILGFLAVLVVAMLISDHYSKANNDRLAADVSEAPQMIDPAAISSYASPLASNTPGNSYAPLPPTHVDANASSAGGGFLGSALDAAGRNADNQSQGRDPMVEHEPLRITMGGNNQGVVDRVTGGISNLPPAINTNQFPADPSRDRANEEALRRQLEEAAKASQGNPTPLQAPAAERWHTVANNDSLFAISKKYYGDGKYWKKLAEANKGRMGDNNTLRPGVRLLIPDAAVLGIAGTAPKVDPAKPDAKPDTKPVAVKPDTQPIATKPATGADRTYEVKKGDTLGEISMRELGTSKRASEILTLNGLKDANSIRVGQKLKLPAK